MILIEQARSSLKDELTSKKKSIALQVTVPYLELAAYVSVESGVSEPIHLMRFYCECLVGKITLQKLARGTQLFIFIHLTQVLEACRNAYTGRTFVDEYTSMRRQIVDAASVLLEVRV